MPEPTRCRWAGTNSLMVAYHDKEWGVPERNGRRLWETLMLEGFEAGLSWSTILNKRVAFRNGFARLRSAEGGQVWCARHRSPACRSSASCAPRAKIEATITGARIYCDMLEQGEKFSACLCWSFTDGEPIAGDGKTVLASTPLFEKISKELKRSRLQVRRSDDRLRVDAGGRDSQ